jgi:tRNA-modifying protein YgfZ
MSPNEMNPDAIGAEMSPESRGLDVPDGYRRLRQDKAAAPVGRDVIRVIGPDAVDYMQGQCSQDVAALEPGNSADALLLEPQGRVDAFVRVTRTGEDELMVDTDAGWGDVVVARLERFKLRVKVEISRVAWSCVAVRGPAADSVGSPSGILRIAVDWPGLGGFDLLGEDPVVPQGVEECGAQAWQAARIEAGIPMMGSEIDERTIPEEAGLVGRCVSFTKGCFTGQELVARLDARGSNVARRLRGLAVAGTGPGSGPGAGTELVAGDKTVGRITSEAWSPGMGCTVALAYVHRSVDMGSTVVAGEFNAEVRQLPLVG